MVTHVRLSPGEGGVKHATMLLSEHLQELHATDVEPDALGPPVPRSRLREVETAILLYLGLDEQVT
jgi:hypothetical protein